MKKRRKPRKAGIDMCPHCFSFDCDPMSMSIRFHNKINKRLKEGLCPACGKMPCKCKSKM